MVTMRDLLHDFTREIIDVAANTAGGEIFEEEINDKIDEYIEIIKEKFVG